MRLSLMREYIVFFVVGFLLFSPSVFGTFFESGHSFLVEKDDRSEWTVLYYMCGDVKDMDGWVDPLIENLTRVTSSESVNIVVFYDGLKCGDFRLFYIDEAGDHVDLTDEYGWPCEVDSSSLTTLEVFCCQMMNRFRADHYALIPVVSGGAGWQLFCLHDASDGKVGVSIPDLALSLRRVCDKTGSGFDVLYTSCAMNMVEIVYELRFCVDFVVGTETCLSEQDLVDRFYEPVWDLRNDSTLSPKDFATRSVVRLHPVSFYYLESYGEKLPWLNRFFLLFPFSQFHPVVYHDSVAVVNSSCVEQLTRVIDDLSDFLIVHKENNELYADVTAAWDKTRKLGKCMAKNKGVRDVHTKWQFQCTASNRFIDMYHFAYNLKQTTQNNQLEDLCRHVMDAVNTSIVSMKKIPEDTQFGLSIYFPGSSHQYNRYSGYGSLPCLYERLSFSETTSWDEFVKHYLEI